MNNYSKNSKLFFIQNFTKFDLIFLKQYNFKKYYLIQRGCILCPMHRIVKMKIFLESSGPDLFKSTKNIFSFIIRSAEKKL